MSAGLCALLPALPELTAEGTSGGFQWFCRSVWEGQWPSQPWQPCLCLTLGLHGLVDLPRPIRYLQVPLERRVHVALMRGS